MLTAAGFHSASAEDTALLPMVVPTAVPSQDGFERGRLCCERTVGVPGCERELRGCGDGPVHTGLALAQVTASSRDASSDTAYPASPVKPA